MKKLVFVSRDANWQKYRNDIFLKYSDEYNVRVDILTTGKLSENLKQSPGLAYHIFFNFLFWTRKLSFFPGALLYILKNRPDVVVCLNNTTQFTEYASFLLCKILGVRFVWWTHGFNHHRLKVGWLQLLKESYAVFFLRRADAIMVFSPAGKDYLISKGVAPAKIYIASNTLDTDKLNKVKFEVSNGFNKSEFLSSIFPSYQSDDDNLVLLFSGRCNKQKKIHNAILLIQRSREVGLCTFLIIVGDGPELDNLKQLTIAAKIDSYVCFVGACYDEKMVSQYFLASDLFIMPGYIGLAIIHAFVFGLPIYTENVPNHSPEIYYLQPGTNGAIFDIDDIDCMLADIVEIFNDRSILKKMQLSTQDVIDNHGNIRNMLANFHLALYPIS